MKYIRQGVPYITLFGLLIGLLVGCFYWLIQLVLPGELAWVLCLFFDVLLTGGFHLDALADMADGLFSSRKKERMLEIMKDSRIGSNGVIALILFYLVMFSVYAYLPNPKWLVVVALSMIGKAGLSMQLYRMVYARQEGGTGNFFSGTSTVAILVSQVIPLLFLILIFHQKGLIAYGLVLLGAYCYRQFVYQKIQGHTGDTLGAFAQLSQLLLVIGLLI